MNSLQLRANSTLRVVSEYDGALVVAFREIKATAWSRYKKSAGWDGGAWNFPLECYPEVRDALTLAGKFELDPAATSAYEKLLRDTAKAVQAAEDHEARAHTIRQQALQRLHLTRPLADGRVLFPHQQDAVKFLVSNGFAILADDMGLGKSLSALVAAESFRLPIHIIAPASLQQNWKNEAERAGIALAGVYSWAKVPKQIEGDYVLIVDEAHYAQSLQSARTKALLALAKEHNCLAAFLLSGTPMKNGQPQHLYPLLKVIKHPITKDKNHYDVHFCDATSTRFTRWDTSGAKNLIELHELTKDRMLRRTKDKVLDLPEKLRDARYIVLTDEQTKIYQQSRAGDVETYRRTKLVKYLGDALGDMTEEEIAEAFESIEEDDLLAMSLLMADRKAASRAKVEPAIEIAEEVVEQGGSIVLFTMFKETANKIASAFDAEGAVITSETKHRQDIVDSFQAGKIKVLVCTFGAGNVGFTLTAAQTVVLVDRPWSPGDAIQAEDRLHRIGQKQTVYAIWLQCDETDKAIDALLNKKETRINKVLEGKAKTLRGVSDGILELARELSEQMKLDVT